MKQCNYCGTPLEDSANFCAGCGASTSSEAEVATPNPAVASYAQEDINDNGNILAGVVGAFLFSLIGGLLYFVIYQLGIIAGICGLVIFVLSNFGYMLFARTKNKLSITALVTSVIMTFSAIFIAEYFCVAYEIYKVLNEEVPVTFFEAFRLTPDFLAYDEMKSAFTEDLLMAYLFSVLATAGNVWNIIKARKAR